MSKIVPKTFVTLTDEDCSVENENDAEVREINTDGGKGYLRIKEIHPQLKREVTRHRFPGKCGIDVIVMPATPRASPVGGLKPKVIRKPQDLDVRVGEDAEFECVVEDPTNVFVSWSKDNRPLFGSGRMLIGSKDDIFFFKISKAEIEDEALYECRVRNDYGEVLLDVQLLVDEDEEDEDIERPAQFHKKLKRMYTVNEGDRLLLEVHIVDDPCTTVSWYYQDQKLISSQDILISSVNNKHSLCIQDVLFDDEGNYKCVIANESGEDECETEVFVEE